MGKSEKIAPRPYKGAVQAVILDWAGTAVDHGSCGPVAVFQEAFGRYGIKPSVAETRKPMGREKSEHVAEMLAMPRIFEEWLRLHGSKPDGQAVQKVYNTVLEIMPATLAKHADPVPGCAQAMEELRKRDIAIGSCTGYSREMMPELIENAAKKGFAPDCLVTSDEVPQGRPWPWLCWQNCMRLGVFPPEAVIKVGDTVADIREGINAGHWSIGVTRTGNLLGLTAEEAAAMDATELERLEEKAARELYEAGAHFVISSVIDLPALCERISGLLENGISPGRIENEA